MLNQSLETNGLYNDFSGLAKLRSHAGKDSPQALEKVAQQFEAIFLQMMLKSMRDASFGDSLFGSQQSDMYRDMFDKQLAATLSKNNGIGLADTLVRQLRERFSDLNISDNPESVETQIDARSINLPSTPANQVIPVETEQESLDFSDPEAFLDRLLPDVQAAADRHGLPAAAIVAQAALETGWGRHMITDAQGNNSFNLFGIKADSRWQGNSVSVVTTEYRDGIVQRERANFRAYDSIRDSIEDYIAFIKEQPRYADALRNTDNPQTYARELQRAGYATDPAYASKIHSIIEKYDIASRAQQPLASVA